MLRAMPTVKQKEGTAMIKYTYKKRELIIPDGIGNINNGGCSECILENKSVQQDSEVATYRPDNGYNGIGRITVDAGGYGQSKWNEGVAYAKGQMVESAFTDNGVYERANGWKKITINVSGGTDPEVIEQAYESGITKGMADQKALLVSTAITANGTYTKEDGYKLNADGTEKWWKGYDPQELYAQNHIPSNGWRESGTIHSQWEWQNGASLPSEEYKQKFQNRVL